MRSLSLYICNSWTSDWCRRGDSNPHELPHTPLKRARLPVPPLRLKRGFQKRGYYSRIIQQLSFTCSPQVKLLVPPGKLVAPAQVSVSIPVRAPLPTPIPIESRSGSVDRASR